jgi:type II restriction enzyme
MTFKPFRRHLHSAQDLVTTPQNARAVSISIALERNRRAAYYVAEARDLKVKAARVSKPRLLCGVDGIRGALSVAAGLPHAGNRNDPAIKHLINNYLEPAGNAFVEELVFRFLLTRGDSLGGSMRNVGGVLAQRKLARALMAALHNAGTAFRFLHGPTGAWADIPAAGTAGLEADLRGLTWKRGKHSRTLFFNLRVPTVRNSVDLCLLDCSADEDQTAAIENPARYVGLGELKGGIDPAGADEHWKTAGSALARIREAFRKQVLNPQIFYVGTAIAEKMASEIWEHLQDGRITNAANLTCDDQVASLCSWLCEL